MTKIKNKSKKQDKYDLKKKSVTENKSTKEGKITSTAASDVKQQSSLKKSKLNKVEKIKANKSTSKNIIVKGNLKQEKWIKHFRSYLNNIKTDDSAVQTCFVAFLKTDSIPKREDKFKKYMTGSFKLSSATFEKVWEAVKGAFGNAEKVEVQTKKAGDEGKGGQKVNGKSPSNKNVQQIKKRSATDDEAEVDQAASSQSPPKKLKATKKEK